MSINFDQLIDQIVIDYDVYWPSRVLYDHTYS